MWLQLDCKLMFNAYDFLEKEEDILEADRKDFTDRMRENNILPGSPAWLMLWKEVAEARLRQNRPEAWAEYLRKAFGREASNPETVDVEDEDVSVSEFIDREDGGEEARVMKMPRPCHPPREEDVRQHDLTHCRYRPRCPVCVAGAADDRRNEERTTECTCPEVSSNYGFLRDKKGAKFYRAMLVSKYRKVGCFASHCVPRKGVGGGWNLQQYLWDLKRWGIRHKVVLRTDGEPAILDLANRVGDLRLGETLLEHSPVGDSRSNGLAERAIQSVQKQIRVLKLALERNMKTKISVEHACFPWLVEHSGDILT